MKKQFLILFAFISVLALSQVPQRFNKVVVTGDIASPKFIKTGSNADSVLLGNGSARAISAIKTDTVSLSNRINAKATGNGTAYGTNTGDETLTSIKTKLGAATSISDGYLKYQDYVKFDGKLSSEVDGSTTNELQTISTNGAAGNITLSNSGGTLNLNVNDADASATNEIQDLSLSGNTLTLSSDATTVNISQATAVLANTAKVSNATHTGDVTGSTALTLATVNSNVGTFNNVTINAKGLATSGSNVSYEPAFTKNTAFNKNFGTTPGTVLEGRTFGTAASSAVGDFIQNQNSSAQSANMWITSSNNGFSGTFEKSAGYGASISLKNTSPLSNAYIRFLDFSGATLAEILPSTSGLNFSAVNVNIAGTTASTLPTNGALVVKGGVGADHVRANNFYGNGSNITGVQLPITLTTNGTSGAATFENGVLNVPNYTQSATGSSYSCTFTNILNTSLALGLMSDYTTVGGVISIAIHGGVSSTGSGKCTFRLSLPAAASPSYKFVVTASDTSKTTGRNIFVEATASNYVDVSFLATAAGEIIEFTIMGNGHQ